MKRAASRGDAATGAADGAMPRAASTCLERTYMFLELPKLPAVKLQTNNVWSRTCMRECRVITPGPPYKPGPIRQEMSVVCLGRKPEKTRLAPPPGGKVPKTLSLAPLNAPARRQSCDEFGAVKLGAGRVRMEAGCTLRAGVAQGGCRRNSLAIWTPTRAGRLVRQVH
eukprot:scaffold105416_cov57-Phaeocystis_antarctica.AAC.1